MLDRPGSQGSVLDVDQPRVVGLDQISRDAQDLALNRISTNCVGVVFHWARL